MKGLETNAKAWLSLPKLNGINVGLRPRKNAHVLASFQKGDRNYPVLVTARVKKGRSLAIATDSLWNWNFRRMGEGGSGRHYNKLWNNLISWLIDDPETRLLKLETDKESYEEGEDILLRASVLQEDYNPAVGANIRLTIKPPFGKTKSEIIKTDSNGDSTYQWNPVQKGFYKVTAKVEMTSQKLQAEIGFSIFSENLEFQEPMVNETLLKRVAEVSNGSYELLTEKTDFSKITFNNPKLEIKTRSKSVSLWDNWWIYGVVLGLLFSDWFIRRKSGLS